jgi:Uma2 family endonuclease
MSFSFFSLGQEHLMAVAQSKRMSEQAYREFALGDTSSQWELVDGHLRERLGMSATHGKVMMRLVVSLANQLDDAAYSVRAQHARLRVSSETYYMPDIAVIPTAFEWPLLEHPNSLDAYADPLPLVVEIWSPSTGRYDMVKKLPDYQRRGDLEIWYVHPVERTLTAWWRRDDGTYSETTYRSGIVLAEALPDTEIDLDTIFQR